MKMLFMFAWRLILELVKEIPFPLHCAPFSSLEATSESVFVTLYRKQINN